MINPLSIAASGLQAAASKMANAANNIANSSTAGFEAASIMTKLSGDGGVQAVSVPRTPAFVPSYAPDSPFSDENGMINAPNVNQDEELITLEAAKQAYQSNAQVIRAAQDMHETLLNSLDTKA